MQKEQNNRSEAVPLTAMAIPPYANAKSAKTKASTRLLRSLECGPNTDVFI